MTHKLFLLRLAKCISPVMWRIESFDNNGNCHRKFACGTEIGAKRRRRDRMVRMKWKQFINIYLLFIGQFGVFGLHSIIILKALLHAKPRTDPTWIVNRRGKCKDFRMMCAANASRVIWSITIIKRDTGHAQSERGREERRVKNGRIKS